LRLHRIASWDIRQCACGLARIDPYPSLASRPAFYAADAIATRKASKRRGPAGRLGRTKGTIFLSELRRLLPAGGRVLDIGCGTGAFLRDARLRYECTGIEISSDLAARARELGVEVLVGDFVDYPFGSRRFDAVTMISLIEHLHEPLDALRRCRELLVDGGLLLLKTVNHGGLNRRVLGARWSGYRPPDHLVYFDPATLRRALNRHGFDVLTARAPLLNDSFYCCAVRRCGADA
jgi:SAM-dependent methyltransferase